MDLFSIPYLKMFLVLLGVVLAIFVCAWAFVRFFENKNQSKKIRHLKLLEVLPIDPKNKLILVHCYDKKHLILLGQNKETLISSEDATNPKTLFASDKITNENDVNDNLLKIDPQRSNYGIF